MANLTCEVCHAAVNELRRGRCWGCYGKWSQAKPVGIGARCIMCGERRRKVLRAVEAFAHWHPMCFNCAGQMAAISPLPPNLAELRVAISRERRAAERRWGKRDGRVLPYERRAVDRRTEAEQALDAVDEAMIVEILVEDEPDFADLTRIHEAPGLV